MRHFVGLNTRGLLVQAENEIDSLKEELEECLRLAKDIDNQVDAEEVFMRLDRARNWGCGTLVFRAVSLLAAFAAGFVMGRML